MNLAAADFLKNDKGEPLVLWRGDSNEFEEFDMRKTRAQSGFFFAIDRRQAEHYAKPILRSFHIRAHKVKDLRRDDIETLRWIQEWAEEFDEWIDRYSGEPCHACDFVTSGSLYDYEGTGSGTRWHSLFRHCRNNGFDTVIAPDVTDGSNEPIVVCFYPTQIQIRCCVPA